jgi:hypothetical protein
MTKRSDSSRSSPQDRHGRHLMRWIKRALVMIAMWPVAAEAQEPPSFEYAAKFICGVQVNTSSSAGWIVVPGHYTTVVNIYNPTDAPLTVIKKLALSYPPGSEKQGQIIDLGPKTLGPHAAFEADCPEVRNRPSPVGPPPLIEGFLIVQSTASIDVSAVYTVAGFSAPHSPSIAVQEVRERSLRP